MKHPIAKIYTDHGVITMELYPEHAPNTVNAFLWAVSENMYVDRTIDRIVPGFVIQPTYDFSDEPECDMILKGEFSSTGFDNPIQFEKGIVAMAGNGTDEAHGCAFFITLADDVKERLQGKFAAFGRVIDGMEEVERIENVPTEPMTMKDAPSVKVNRPLTPEYIRKVEVDTFGVEYPKPEILRWGE